MNKRINRNGAWITSITAGVLAATGVLATASAHEHGDDHKEAAGPVRFHDIAVDGGAGIAYRRVRSPRDELLQKIKDSGFFAFPDDANSMPLKSRGAPGVAVFDYDGDGDQDIYVTNGPGAANSLYANQLRETGHTGFIDMASAAGVDMTEYDNTGVCYGDLDNDGDEDLLVLTLGGQNHLFENRGDGTFIDITEASGIAGGNSYSTSCSMGDIDADGLLDIAISNTFTDWRDNLPINTFEAAVRNENNQLLKNLGGNRFEDVSSESGILTYRGISWTTALVDYDQDGDVDLFFADDQGGKPSAKRGGFDTGYIRIYSNDGTGHFEDVTELSGTNRAGAWMGLAFGDFNSDGRIDFFASNIGDYVARFMTPMVPFEVQPGDWLSGWFLGEANGRFRFPGVGELKATPFGWGNAAVDYDNDGDTDIIYHGGIDFGAFTDASNPGAILNNDGHAAFSRDALAYAADPTNHARRLVQGVAVGDFNDDGFADIVSVSSQNWPTFAPLMTMLPADAVFGGGFDDARIWPTFRPVDPANPFSGFRWNGIDPEDGTLAVDISSGNSNKWVKVSLRGTAGLIPGARGNRDGIGAVLRFTPEKGVSALHPVVGGSSYASQHSLQASFGLGERDHGTLDIRWPGGVRNRLYGVRAYERLTIPEIPCSFDDPDVGRGGYRRCVTSAIHTLRDKGMLNGRMARRLLHSAMRAYRDQHHERNDHGAHDRDHARRQSHGSERHHDKRLRHGDDQDRYGG